MSFRIYFLCVALGLVPKTIHSVLNKHTLRKKASIELKEVCIEKNDGKDELVLVQWDPITNIVASDESDSDSLTTKFINDCIHVFKGGDPEQWNTIQSKHVIDYLKKIIKVTHNIERRDSFWCCRSFCPRGIESELEMVEDEEYVIDLISDEKLKRLVEKRYNNLKIYYEHGAEMSTYRDCGGLIFCSAVMGYFFSLIGVYILTNLGAR